MGNRYLNDFSFRFLDDIQGSYECCDHIWFRANGFNNRLPLTCYASQVPMKLHHDTCPNVLARLVNLRCIMISISLIIILISLISLVVVAICELMGQEYDVAEREDNYRRNISSNSSSTKPLTKTNNYDDYNNKNRGDEILDIDDQHSDKHTQKSLNSGGHLSSSVTPLRAPSRTSNRSHFDDDDDAIVSDQFIQRLASVERERETPLLAREQYNLRNNLNNNNNDNNIARSLSPISSSSGPRTTERPAPILLTRANFTSIDDHRTHSPTFLDDSNNKLIGTNRHQDQDRQSTYKRAPLRPSKSSLKNSATNEIGFDSDNDEPDDIDHEDQVQEYHREVQTRRSSSMNVRFNIK